MKSSVICHECLNSFECENGRINRANKSNLPIFCNRKCAGKHRQIIRTKDEKIELKRIYDAEYRAKNSQLIKKKKSEHFKKTYDPEKARIDRKINMHKHVEYCRNPEYKVKKSEYDRNKRLEEYGYFSECKALLMELEKEIRSRATKYEINKLNGYYTRSAIARRRALWQQKQI